MSDITMIVEYDDEQAGFDARKVLKMARATLDLLGAIERDRTKKRYARVRWDVNIYSLSDRAVVEFTHRRDGKPDLFDLEAMRAAMKETKPKPVRPG